MPGPFDPTTRPAAFAALEAVIELGKRQRRLQGASMRLGEFTRQREIDGERLARVHADFRKWQHRLTAAVDPYGMKG